MNAIGKQINIRQMCSLEYQVELRFPLHIYNVLYIPIHTEYFFHFLKMDEEPKNFNCEICKKILSNNQSKKQHIRIVHGEEKTFVCNVCSSSFGSKRGLKSHIENNHQEGHHTCKSCGKVFASSGSLEKHIKGIHEAQRNYKCNSCEKSFTKSGSLKRHIDAIHDNKESSQI